MSIELVDRDWDAAIRAGLSRDSSSFRIVCPFVKERVLARLIKEHRPSELRLITRLNLADFASGVSDIGALQAALRAGGQVRGVRDLHAKVFLFGTTRAAVTSANLTARGLAGNHELGCVSEDKTFVDGCADYFDALWDAAGSNVTSHQLADWAQEVGEHLDSGARPTVAAALPDYGATVNVAAAAQPDPAPSGWPAESGHAFVKFFGNGNNRLGRGESTFGEVQRSGCHWACTYPAGKRPRAVRDGDTLFVGRLVANPNDTMIFGRVIGRRHRGVLDDATPEEIELRPFKSQWPHYVRVHHGQFVGGTLDDGVSLTELMNNLGSDAFVSTKVNAAAGRGNTHAPWAYRQQPHVRLTAEAAAWVTARLEDAFLSHGTVPGEDLDQLDWP